MNEALPWPVQNIAEWLPFWKAAGFFLATFVLEDVAAIGAGLLLATGAVSWPLAFASCFTGIWLGDTGLYALARLGGRNWFERSSLRKFSNRVSRSETWFAERGTPILIFSRCVPGARLPTYLAAGFLRLPLPRFLCVTAAAAFVWTLVILRLAQMVGSPLIRWVNTYRDGSLVLLAAGAGAVTVYQLCRRSRTTVAWRKFLSSVERWRRWEFWPAWMFYPPVAGYCVWLALKYRGLSLPTVANPGIASGGVVGESKMATLWNLMATSQEFTAAAELVSGQTFYERSRALRLVREQLGLQFPFVLKPDVGQRGAGVKLIRTETQAEEYLRQTAAPLVIQRYVPGPFEAGIFYYRLPNEPTGRIFAITEKIFPTLTGDGQSTIGELIQRDSRARLMTATYQKRFAARWAEVLPANETLKLVEAGNHAQGCIFRDGKRLWSPELEQRIDEISRNLDGFFIGRYDLRFENENDLRAGRNFQIVELNGAASEATSIYDSRNSLWTAYRTLFQQWDLVFAIGAENRRRGATPTPVSGLWRKWREYSRMSASYPSAD